MGTGITMTQPSASPPLPPPLDPPFRGYIETTFDALLVFEAARRGMIPRVTRRLIERERGMVQSGAVFVFDEQESGIKRWTDGLVWSPSRILGNFLVSCVVAVGGLARGLEGIPSWRECGAGLARMYLAAVHGASMRRGRSSNAASATIVCV